VYCPPCGTYNEDNAQFCRKCGTNLLSGEASVGAELPMVAFGEAIGRGFSNYFNFSGRATRAEHWWWVLFAALLGIIPFAGFVTLIPSLAVGARRLHDINRSGWWLLLLWPWLPLFVALVAGTGKGPWLLWLWPLSVIVSVIGWIVLIVWACMRGDGGPNKYGPDPLRAPSSQPNKH
jgi:uncharacterized membrane protein YhaH (DUF805 family)